MIFHLALVQIEIFSSRDFPPPEPPRGPRKPGEPRPTEKPRVTSGGRDLHFQYERQELPSTEGKKATGGGRDLYFPDKDPVTSPKQQNRTIDRNFTSNNNSSSYDSISSNFTDKNRVFSREATGSTYTSNSSYSDGKATSPSESGRETDRDFTDKNSSYSYDVSDSNYTSKNSIFSHNTIDSTYTSNSSISSYYNDIKATSPNESGRETDRDFTDKRNLSSGKVNPPQELTPTTSSDSPHPTNPFRNRDGTPRTFQEPTPTTGSDSPHPTNPFRNSDGTPRTFQELTRATGSDSPHPINPLIMDAFKPHLSQEQISAIGSDSASHTNLSNNKEVRVNPGEFSSSNKEVRVNPGEFPSPNKQVRVNPGEFPSSNKEVRANPGEFPSSNEQVRVNPGDRPGKGSPEQLLAAGQEKQEENQAILAVARSELNDTVRKVNELANFNINLHVANLGLDWLKEHPKAAPGNPEKSIYTQIYAAERTETYLKDHKKALIDMRKSIKNQKNELPSINSAIENYKSLWEEINNDPTADERLRVADFIYRRIWQENYDNKQGLVKEAESQIEKINESLDTIDQTLDQLTGQLNVLKEQKPDTHPFFLETEMHQPELAPIDFVRRGELAGASLVNAIRTVLKDQGINVNNERGIAQTLGLHPLTDRIDLKNLKTALASLEDTRELQFQVIKPEDLRTALGEGPIVAFLDNARYIWKVPLEHHITLAHMEWNPKNIQESQVVVLDELRPEEPYKVSVKELTHVWDGAVILPGKAYKALDAKSA